MPTTTRHNTSRTRVYGAAPEHGPRREPGSGRKPEWRSWYAGHAPVLISRIAVLLGLLALLDAFAADHSRLSTGLGVVLPTPARTTADAVVAVAGLGLLRLAAGLRRRKRGEWQLAVLITAVMALAYLVREDRGVIQAGAALLLLVALLSTRAQFKARSDPRTRWFALRVAGQLLSVAVVFGFGMLLMPGHVAEHVGLWARLREVLLSLVGLGGELSIGSDHYSAVFHASLLGFGLLVLSSGVVLALRPAEPTANLSAEDERLLRRLLEQDGRSDSLGYFALRRDKLVVWSASGKAAVAYRVVCGVALASGDPIGDREAWPGAIEAFRRQNEEFGWVPAVIGCSEAGAIVFKRVYGLCALRLGDEAIIDTATFNLQGRAMRGVRQACTRIARGGYTVEVRRTADTSAEERVEIRAAAAAWRGEVVERGYSMALCRLAEAQDGDCVIVTARRAGALCGLLHFVPWGPDGLSLDLMRRDASTDNGVNEFMIAELAAAGRSLGVDRLSLNFAMFREALEHGERIGAGPVLRLWRSILLLASRWWQIDSLYRFNAKFRPDWAPRFISYPAARDLPRIAWAAMEAEAFIVRPKRVKKLLGRA